MLSQEILDKYDVTDTSLNDEARDYEVSRDHKFDYRTMKPEFIQLRECKKSILMIFNDQDEMDTYSDKIEEVYQNYPDWVVIYRFYDGNITNKDFLSFLHDVCMELANRKFYPIYYIDKDLPIDNLNSFMNMQTLEHFNKANKTGMFCNVDEIGKLSPIDHSVECYRYISSAVI